IGRLVDIGNIAGEELKSTKNVFYAGNILYGKLRPYLNKVYFAEEDGICSTDIWVLNATNVIDPLYAVNYLRSSLVVQQVSQLTTGANLPRIAPQSFDKISIPLPPLPEQRRIATILREADEIRKLRREADEKAQKIVEALFYDMFGDPGTNPKKWRITKIANLLPKDKKGITTGPFGSLLKKNELVDEGVPVWGINNVLPNEFVETGASFITAEKYKRLLAYTVQSGDILISRAGTVGRVCVAYPSSVSIIGTNLVKITLDTSQISPEYFTTLFTFFSDRIGNLRASGEGNSYSFLNPATLVTLQIPVPPRSLQNKFITSLVEMRRQVNIQKQSRHHFDTLFQSLLSHAFSGELTASWRNAHAAELIQAAQERDELLRELRGSFSARVAEPHVQYNLAQEREELRSELTPLQSALVTLIDCRPESYASAYGLHQEIIASQDEEGAYLPDLDEERLFRDFDRLDCSLDSIRRELHFLASVGLVKELSRSDQNYITLYRSLLMDDDSQEEDLALLGEEVVEEVSV